MLSAHGSVKSGATRPISIVAGGGGATGAAAGAGAAAVVWAYELEEKTAVALRTAAAATKDLVMDT